MHRDKSLSFTLTKRVYSPEAIDAVLPMYKAQIGIVAETHDSFEIAIIPHSAPTEPQLMDSILNSILDASIHLAMRQQEKEEIHG